MAKYDWGDGNGKIHSISLAAHQANAAAQQTVAGAFPQGGAGLGLGAGALAGLAPTPGFAVGGGTAGNAPAATPAAGGTPGTPATTPVAGTITPDATYLANAALAAFNRTTKINELSAEGKDDKTNTTTAIQRLIENAVGDLGNIDTGAGKEGLFYSGQLTKRRADYQTALDRNKGDMQTGLDQRQAARDAARTALEQGAPLDDAVEMAAAGTRQVGRDTAAADLGALVPNVNTGGSTQVAAVQQLINPAAKPAAAKAYTNKQESGGEWHIYPSGKRVWVPKRR